MDTGLQVTDARRLVLVGATVIGSLLVGGIALVAVLVVPVLSRLGTTIETLNTSLPILEQVGPDVDSLEGNVGEIAPDVDSLDDTVRDVRAGLGTVTDSIDGLHPPLGTIDDSVRGVDDSVRGVDASLQDVADRLDTLDASLQQMQGSLGALGVLPNLLDELGRTTAGVGTIADHTATMGRELGQLAAALERITALLEETEQHVENLDRKTGPVLLDDGRTAE